MLMSVLLSSLGTNVQCKEVVNNNSSLDLAQISNKNSNDKSSKIKSIIKKGGWILVFV